MARYTLIILPSFVVWISSRSVFVCFSSEMRRGFGHKALAVWFGRFGKHFFCRNAAVGREAERMLGKLEKM